jgi:hypothetical protein
VENLAKLRRIDPVETLTPGQKELLQQALARHQDLVPEELVVYRMDDGHDLVAARSPNVSLGDCLISAGGWADVHWKDAIGEADRDGDVTLHIAPAVGDAVRWLSSDVD